MLLSLFGETDYAEAVEVLTESFCHNDPIELALGIQPDEFRVMIRAELDAVPPDDMSMLVRDADTGRMLAIMLAYDATTEAVDSGSSASPKFRPIAEISREVHGRYFAARTVVPGSHLYLFALGVLPEMAGRGIGTRLTGAVLERARDRGYSAAFSMATNPASSRILKWFGFDVIETIGYGDYRFEGEAVFASISDSGGIDVLECVGLADWRAPERRKTAG